MGNVLDSNTVDLLVAIPVGVLIAGATPIDFAMATPMFGALTGATILVFTTLGTDMALERWESGLLLLAYCGFIAWVLAEISGLVAGILPA